MSVGGAGAHDRSVLVVVLSVTTTMLLGACRVNPIGAVDHRSANLYDDAMNTNHKDAPNADDMSTVRRLVAQRRRIEDAHRTKVDALNAEIDTAAVNYRVATKASWQAIADIIGGHKNTVRVRLQDRVIAAGGPSPRIARCAWQLSDAAGWCRNGVARVVVDARGVKYDVCHAHADAWTATGAYTDVTE